MDSIKPKVYGKPTISPGIDNGVHGHNKISSNPITILARKEEVRGSNKTNVLSTFQNRKSWLL
jgi:hypothetical protein